VVANIQKVNKTGSVIYTFANLMKNIFRHIDSNNIPTNPLSVKLTVFSRQTILARYSYKTVYNI